MYLDNSEFKAGPVREKVRTTLQIRCREVFNGNLHNHNQINEIGEIWEGDLRNVISSNQLNNIFYNYLRSTEKDRNSFLIT